MLFGQENIVHKQLETDDCGPAYTRIRKEPRTTDEAISNIRSSIADLKREMPNQVLGAGEENLRLEKISVGATEAMQDFERMLRKEREQNHVKNTNDQVWVQLTEYGRKIYSDHIERTLKGTSLKPEDHQVKIDDYGYAKFTIWQLMNIFGECMFMSNNHVPFEGNEFYYKKPKV
jgi:MFS superfamily sulfate permease-like transporter